MRRLVLTSLACAALLGGCNGAGTTGSSGAALLCDAMGRCAAGEACRDGVCHATCTSDAECDAGACRERVCWTASAGACATDADCAATELCVSGACVTPPTTVTCAADADCPSGGRCDGGTCVAACVAEVCNGLDDDCDGSVDEGCGGTCASDADCASGEACVSGSCRAATSCASDADCAPSEVCVSGTCASSCSAEVCGNGLDDDCDGFVDEGCSARTCRSDGDCARGEVCSGGVCTVSSACASDADCAPSEACVSGTCAPSCTAEVCGNGVDDDCDGIIDEGCSTGDADGDGYPSGSDCDDGDPSVHPGAAELCDGIDQDCDGTIDEGCSSSMPCRSDADCAPGQVCTSGACS